MQIFNSPHTDAACEAQSLIGQTFAGQVTGKQDDTLAIAIADPNGNPIPLPCILPKAAMIGFTPTIKDTRYTHIESGTKLFVRVTAVDLDQASPVVTLCEVSSLR